MINDKMANISIYKGLNKNIDTAINYILKHDLAKLPIGQTIIDDKNVFINKFSYNTLEEKDCFFEGHQKYIDIHIVIKGEELIGYTHRNDCIEITHYDAENDFSKFEGKTQNYYKLCKNDFVITFPWDIHMPKIQAHKSISALVDKLVVKILLD